MSLSLDEVQKVARLARLELAEAVLPRMQQQLSAILDYVDLLQQLDTEGVEPMAHPVPLTNVLRADVPGVPFDRDEVLASAPAAEAGQFRVPPVLGEEP